MRMHWFSWKITNKFNLGKLHAICLKGKNQCLSLFFHFYSLASSNYRGSLLNVIVVSKICYAKQILCYCQESLVKIYVKKGTAIFLDFFISRITLKEVTLNKDPLYLLFEMNLLLWSLFCVFSTTCAIWSNRPKSWFRVSTNSDAVSFSDKGVKLTMSAYKILKKGKRDNDYFSCWKISNKNVLFPNSMEK